MNSNELPVHVASVAQLNLDLGGGDSSVPASNHTKKICTASSCYWALCPHLATKSLLWLS